MPLGGYRGTVDFNHVSSDSSKLTATAAKNSCQGSVIVIWGGFVHRSVILTSRVTITDR